MAGGAAAGQEGWGTGGLRDEGGAGVAEDAARAEGAHQLVVAAGALVAGRVTRWSDADLEPKEAIERARVTGIPAWALYAGIEDWASLPEPVQRARSDHFLATSVADKAAARAALRTALAEAAQGAGAVTGGIGLAGSRTRPREGEASPPREPGASAGRGSRGRETRDRKANRVEDPRKPMAADLGGGGDEEDMQGFSEQDEGLSQQQLALMLEDMGMKDVK